MNQEENLKKSKQAAEIIGKIISENTNIGMAEWITAMVSIITGIYHQAGTEYESFVKDMHSAIKTCQQFWNEK